MSGGILDLSVLDEHQKGVVNAVKPHSSLEDRAETEAPPKPDAQQPIPLVSARTPEPEFPLLALGRELGAAAEAIADIVQCPRAIAGQSVLAAVAVAAQGFHNVVIDDRRSPLSLNMLTVAGSGDRKSAADNIATQPIYEEQKALLEQYKEDFKDYKASKTAYDAELSKIKADKKTDFYGKKDAISRLGDEPTPPTYPRFLCAEPTLEGLQKSYIDGQPSQGLFSDEGGQFFGGHAMNPDTAMRSISGLSKFWDGNSPIERTRAGAGENMMLYSRRLSIHLMAQPIIADKVLSDPLLNEQGFLARFLIARTDSIAGTRLYNHKSSKTNQAIQNYHSRITRLFRQGFNVDEDGGLIFSDMTLSSEAHSLWVAAYNATEQQLGRGGNLEPIKPAASKMAENIARIAGVLAFYDEASQISKTHMLGAIELGNYYLKNYQRIVNQAGEDVELQRANDLLAWIKNQGGEVSMSRVLRCSPRPIGARAAKRGRHLMSILEEYKHVRVTGINQRNQPDTWEVVSNV